ncbi:MAG TPA: hypothetical protein PLI18_11305 [Pirellulaceae bacterium]|nr:hypothetical protein [Pirellulaceae bacterium]
MSRSLGSESLLREAFVSVRRHFVASTFVFLLLCAATVAVLLFYPRLYASEGMLFVQLGRSVATLDPTSSNGQTVNVQETRETEIRSIAEILQGRQMAEKVVDQIGVDRIMDDGWPEWLTIPSLPSLSPGKDEAKVSDEHTMSSAELERARFREAAVNRVMQRLEVRPGQRNTVIAVSARAQTPFLARDVVQTLLELYREEHVRVHKTEGSLEFFEARVREHQLRVETSEQAIREFKIAHSLVTIDGERSLLQQKIDRIELGMMDTEAEIAATEARRRRLIELAESYDETETTQIVRGLESSTAGGLRVSLFELQKEYSRQRALLADGHPRLQVLEEQIRLAREEQGEVEEQVVQQTEEPNAKRRALELEVDQEGAKLEGLVVRRRTYETELATARERLQKLAETEVLLADLERDRDVAVGDLLESQRKRSQAQVNAGLDDVKIANLSTQPATLVLKHVAPKGSIVLPLGAVAAGFLSIAFAVWRERSRPSMSPRELAERGLDLPVLMTVPRVAPSVLDRIRVVAMERPASPVDDPTNTPVSVR